MSVNSPTRSALYVATSRKLNRLANSAAKAAETRTTVGLARYQELAAKARPLREIVEALDAAFDACPRGSATARDVELQLGRDLSPEVVVAIEEEQRNAIQWGEHLAASARAAAEAERSRRAYEAEWLAAMTP